MKTLLFVFLFVAGCHLDEPLCVEGGCDTTTEPLPRQPEAEDLVWRGCYDQHDAPPEVTWVLRGDCPGDPTQFSVYSGGCAIGIHRPASDEVWINVTGEEWDTYAHEMLHAHLGRATGDSDHDHANPAWLGLYQDCKQEMKDRGFNVFPGRL